jgi:hypothetical protein
MENIFAIRRMREGEGKKLGTRGSRLRVEGCRAIVKN